MRILIEGCDGVGKTTLAKILAEKYNLDYCHCTQNDLISKEFYLHSLNKNNIVWDRHFIGEMIYPKLFKRDQMLTKRDFFNICTKIKELNVIVLVLTTDVLTIRERLDKRGTEHKIIYDNIKLINDQFLKIAINNNFVIINGDFLNLKAIFEIIDQVVKGEVDVKI